ncbi:MAG: hypothetical protein JXB04_00095, partial [Kiritimatiellae bacterium]|nr:hypothetical protein [Kiritimatiellia bacterium]
RYYQDGDSAVLEVSVSDEQVPSSETILRRYVFGPEGPAPLFARKETGSVEAFFHADEQGSVLGLTDYTGQPVTVLEHYRYQRDFGEVTLHAGVSGTPASQIFPNLFGQPYLWKGGKLDRWLYDQCNGGENLGPWLLYHMGDRAYDPWTAAYLQRANVGPIAGRAFENPASVMDNPAEGAAGIRNPTGWPGAFGVAAIGSGPPTAPPCPVQRPLGAGDEEDPEEDEEEDPDRAEKDQGGGIIPPPENDIYNTDIDLEIYPEDVDPDILVDDNAPSRGLDPHQKAKVQETIDFIKALIAADPSLASKFGSIVKALEDALKNDIFEVCNLPGDKLAAVAGGQGRSGIEPGERIQLDPNWFQTDVVTRASLLVHESVHLLRAWSSHGNPAVAEKIDERNALFLEQSFVDAVARNAESLDSALKPKHNFGWLAASRNGRLESEWNKIFPPIRPDRTDRNYRIPPAFCQ